MRKHKDVREVSIKKGLTSVTCNRCGDESKVNQDFNDAYHQEFSLSFSYGSQYDMENWKFDLCENCLTEMIKTFKIVPDGFGEDSYYAAYPQAMFDNWKETGDVNLEFGMTEEEIEARGGSIYMSDEDDWL